MEIKPINPVIATAFQKETLAAFAIDRGHPYDTDFFAFGALNGNKVIGTIDGYTLYDWVYVTFLAIDPAHRGRGIGSLLLDRVESDMRAVGFVGVQIDTFRYQAPDFYRARGYSERMVLPGRSPDRDRLYFELRL